MKIDFIIVSGILVIISFLPFILLPFLTNTKKKNLRRKFKEEALRLSFNITFELIWNSNIAGIDILKKQFLFVQEPDSDFVIQHVDLNKVSTSDYKFVSNSELSNSVRVVNTVNAGTISGTVTGDNSAKTVLYAYEKGTFSNSESQANGSGVQFANAVSSTEVNSNNFSLHFMEGGEYELHFASYEDTNDDGSLEFQGLLEASTASELSLLNLSVTSNTEVSVAVIITGFLGM